MKKYLSLAAAVAVTAMTFSAYAAKSDTAKSNKPTLACSFTEPFFQVVILAKGQTVGNVGDLVAYRSPGKDTVVGSVASKTVSKGVTSLKLEGGFLDEYTLDIVFGKPGNDGMSDKVYESEAIFRTDNDVFVNYGGCDLVP